MCTNLANLIDDQFCLVIDVTYRCNGNCVYCQWASKQKPENLDEPDTNIFIPEATIAVLGVERIVLSGGEPLLRNDLERIISYYSCLNVKSIIVITNGLLLSEERLNSLIQAGLTGITFSLDGVLENVSFAARGLIKEQHKSMLCNINNALQQKKANDLEIGINTVVSKANLNFRSMNELIRFCNNLGIDWLKFNPLFDDGFVSANAPEIMLKKEDSALIRQIGNEIVKKCAAKTNHIHFWNALASVLEGNQLSGSSCGLDDRQAIAIRGDIKFCFWINEPIYGSTTIPLSRENIPKVQEKFKINKKLCRTGFYCFCLQNFDHRWEVNINEN